MTVTVRIRGVGGWLALAGLLAVALLTPITAWFDGRNRGRHEEWLKTWERQNGWRA